MRRECCLPACVCLGLALLLTLAHGAAAQDGPLAALPENWRPDGTYVLDTDDLRSIQAYYRDVGMGRLFLPTAEESRRMREHCLALGRHWRPLGHVKVPSRRRVSRLYLCFYDAPNPEHVARAKCGNLGLRLLENRRHERKIVCGRPEFGAGLG